MQLEEIYRRSIVCPRKRVVAVATEEAGEDDSGTLEEYDVLWIDDDFMWLLSIGVFQVIATATGVPVGDYETDRIPPEKVKNIIPALTVKFGRLKDPEVQLFLERLGKLCAQSLEQQVPLYFVL